MRNYYTIVKLLFILIIPLGSFAQDNNLKEEPTFDQGNFMESNYDLLKTFAYSFYDSSNYVTCIMVSEDYKLDGLAAEGSLDSLTINALLKRRNAKTAITKEKLILTPGKELFSYFADKLNPETIISFRKLSTDEVQVKRYELGFN